MISARFASMAGRRLPRSREFRQAVETFGALVENLYEHRPDHIVFSGDGFQLRARNNDVLAFSSAGDTGCGGEAAIRFNGGDNTWNGVVYAPAGTIRSCSTAQPCSPNDPPGRKTTFNGGLIGWIVDLDSPNFAII